MTAGDIRSADAIWPELLAYGERYTCYSSALAAWLAHERADWPSSVDTGLTLTVFDAGEGLFGFVHFPPRLREELGLVRVCAQRPGGQALDGVLGELERSGRVIVAGDGWRLPWHVAYGKRHVPHWFVLGGTPDRIEAIDPFAARNELGAQEATRVALGREQLSDLLHSLPGEDPVFGLRERLALGDDCGVPHGDCQWFVQDEVADTHAPQGSKGADGLRVLAQHVRAGAQDLQTYRQADDLWSIGRHRAFLARRAAIRAEQTGDGRLAEWTAEYAEPLAGRWAHIAPLLLQARLALEVGRTASDSLATTLEDLAAREQAAAQALPQPLPRDSI